MKVNIIYGSNRHIMGWDGTQASMPIFFDGSPTPFQTADARHSTDKAVRLVLEWAYGHLFETEQDAEDEGYDPKTQPVVIWDDVEYEEVE